MPTTRVQRFLTAIVIRILLVATRTVYVVIAPGVVFSAACERTRDYGSEQKFRFHPDSFARTVPMSRR